MWQDDRARAALQIVNVDDLRVRILNVRYGEANRLRRLSSSSKPGNHDGEYGCH